MSQAPELDVIEQCRSITANHQAAKINGILVDAQTAQIIVRVADALSPERLAKYKTFGIQAMATTAWKLVAATKAQ